MTSFETQNGRKPTEAETEFIEKGTTYGNTFQRVGNVIVKKAKFPVVCLECGKKFTTSSMLPECPECGGSDIDVR